MSNLNVIQSERAVSLADRILHGASALETYAERLSDSDWHTPVTGDGRTVGVVVHHVASSYPLEIELAQILASGQSIVDATTDVVDEMNANHALRHSFHNLARIGATLTQEE